MPRPAQLLLLLALAPSVTACGAHQRHAPTGGATLGVVWSPGGQIGYGEISPHAVFNGGDGTGRADHLRWRGWGSARAVGTGRGWGPSGRVPVQLIATELGPCRGHDAYRRIVFWFPTLKPRRGASYDICPRR